MKHVILCALALAVPVSALADMTQSMSRSITLDVRNASSGGRDGYVDTTASNGQVYSYKYTGGDNNTGDVTFHGRGPATVVVHLKSDPRYAIDEVKFPDDPNSQLSTGTSPNDTTAVIQDKNDQQQTATYKVTVKDSSADATVPCDPRIVNN
jgi:hypothetical protein